jgi:hypothetical protein
MASTKKTQIRMQALAFADAIQRIIGQAIGHGYQDGRIGKQEPDKHCKAFADELIDGHCQLVEQLVQRQADVPYSGHAHTINEPLQTPPLPS